RKTLCKRTQKALRINSLFEIIGMDKIRHIKTYSADTISRFTNSQIQTIIDHFTEKPNMEFTDDPEGTQAEERTDEMVRAKKEFLVSLGIVDENTDIASGATSKI